MVAAAVVGGAVIGGVASSQAAKKGAKAAGSASDAQERAALASIDYQRESRDLARGDLSPFVNFATGSVDQYDANNYANLPIAETRENFDPEAYLAAHPELRDQKVWNTRNKDYFDHYQEAKSLGGSGQYAFTPIAGASRTGPSGGSVASPGSPLAMLARMLTPQGQMDYLQQNPLFDIALNNVNRQSNNAFLGRGKVGDATGQLVNNAYLAGTPLLQNQTANLFNAANLGQSSAAGMANTALTSGAGISSTLEGAGNARAAGIIGAGNAQAQGIYGIGNAIGTGLTAYGMYNQPSGAVSGGYGGYTGLASPDNLQYGNYA